MSDHTAPEIAAVLKRLENPHLKAIDLGLERIENFLTALGNPERQIPPVIHVAGTNGKGSLIAFLQSTFQTAGYKVHRYISPHLVRFNERIMIAGEQIADAPLLNLLTEIEELAKSHPATFFESTTVAAFKAFAETPADVTLLEVGLGGRLDASNVIQNPMLTAITPISFDHTRILGNTLSKIAKEKAGIIKKNTPCIVGPQQREAMEVIEQVAKKQNAPLFRYGHEWHVIPKAGSFHYHSTSMKLEIPAPGLPGEHQYFNAATSIACIDALQHFNCHPNYTITENHLTHALAHATWPGRLQKLTKGPLQKKMSQGCELWLDGGHNPAGGQILGKWAQSLDSIPLYLVLGMLEDKDATGFLGPIAPHIAAVYTVAIPGEPKTQDVERLKGIAEALDVKSETAASVADALHLIQMQAKAPYRVLITGSLYLAGAVLAENG